MKYFLRRLAYSIVFVSCIWFTGSAAQEIGALVQNGANTTKALIHKELSDILMRLHGGEKNVYKTLEAFGLKLSPVEGRWKLLRRDSKINPNKASYVVYEEQDFNQPKKKIQVIFSLIPQKGWEAMLKQTPVSLIKVGTGMVDGHTVTVYYHKAEKVVILGFQDLAYVLDPRHQDTVLPMYATVAVGNVVHDSSPHGIQKVLDTYISRLFARLSVTDENTFAVDTTKKHAPLQLRYTPSVEAKGRYSKEGDGSGQLQANLDHDGRLETVVWKKFSTTNLGDFYQLIVYDDDGSILWSGPRKADDTDPLVFFSLDTGVSLPQILMDVDLDGKVELLAPMVQSDVSPTYFRKLRWTGKQFQPLQKRALILKQGRANGFVWTTAQKSNGVWVSKLTPAKDGLTKVQITQLNVDGEILLGEVLIRFIRNGAVIKRVLKPLRRETSSQTTSSSSKEHTYSSRSDWKGYYENRRLGFSFAYPEKIFTRRSIPKPGDEEGIILYGPGGLTFSVFAADYDQHTNESYREELQLAREEGSQIHYKTLHRNWYVISGVERDGQMLFYEKFFFHNTFVISMIFRYRIADKRKYDPVVSEMIQRAKVEFQNKGK